MAPGRETGDVIKIEASDQKVAETLGALLGRKRLGAQQVDSADSEISDKARF